MQHYNKIQKFISFLLIFSILFSFTINVTFFSFLGTIFASDTKTYNLVSIFVQEEIYDDVKTSLNTYARNIQNTLENTKTIIIPTPSDEHPFNISSLNEKLYFEGYDGLDGLSGKSKLIGTILVGNLALPVVENAGSLEKTIFPYVDFDDKLYIYDNSLKKYKLNDNIKNDPKAEVWHGVISPNSGNQEQDIIDINDYFEKNNDFYKGTGSFQTGSGLTNGNQEEDLIDNYEPAVFYYDQIRETKALNYVNYKAYEGYLDNIEDISYNRFSKELAEKLKQNYFGAQGNEIGDTTSIFGTGFDISKMLEGPTTYNVPDVQVRHIIQNTTKKFLEIFNGSTIGEFRKDVHNAGRYNSGATGVGVDLIPTLITNVDTLSQLTLKNVNNDLEDRIDNLVKKGLSRDIAVPSTFVLDNSTYTNFLYGMSGGSMSSAKDCTMYRGSTYARGQLIEANRAFNINNISPDIAKCQEAQTRGYWGGNSPANLDTSNSVNGEIYKLKFKNTKNAVVPLYDILGGLKSTDVSKNPNPNNCFDNNLLLTNITEDDGTISYNVPINGQGAVGWNCNSTNQKLSYTYDFDYTYKKFPTLPVGACENHYLKLDGKTIKTYGNTDCASTTTTTSEGTGATTTTTTQTPSNVIYNFHKINSWIEHKSPNSTELSSQTQYMISPNLPIDKDRYIDFVSADSSYAKINYPYLYRIILDENEELTLDNAKKSLKKYLDQKSSEINSIINQKNPSKLSGSDKLILSYLSTGSYPQANVDLYKELENKPDKEVEILGDKKTISYIDTLIFAIFWNNLNSVSAKYKFVFENYLSDQFGGNDYNFYLPKNKKQYEISYLGAPGDAQNMYVKLDPEDKGENPYSDIIANNQNLDSYLLNIGSNSGKNSGNFKCAPPEGVPIWEWIPAVMCRLSDMLPPTITVTGGKCGFLLDSDDDSEGYSNSEDANKNGINDYLEQEWKNGSLELKSDSSKYYYNRTGILTAKALNSSGSLISFDSVSDINFELLKVVAPQDETKVFNNSNSKIIYDKTSNDVNQTNSGAQEQASKYVGFKDISARLSSGEVQYNFSTKSKDTNLTFRATLNLKDDKGNIVISKNDILEVQVRGDLFYATSYKLENFDGEQTLDSGVSSVTASESQSIFLIEDENFNALKSNPNSLKSLSNSKDKLFLSLFNNDKNGNSIEIAYPLVVKVLDDDEKNVVEPFTITSLSNPKSIGIFKKSGTYTIEIKDLDGNIIKKEIQVLPDTAVKIVPDLSTNLMEKDGVITANVFSIYDQFENPTIGEFYDVEAVISGNSLTFEDGTKTKTYQVYEGYKPFKIKSTSNSGVSNIKFTLKLGEKEIQEKIVQVNVVDKIDFDLLGLPQDIKVGNNSYDFTLKLKGQNESTSFNSRVYLVSNNIYITPNKEYFDLKDNTGTGSFSTTTKAGENIKLEFKVNGVKNSIYKEINILPDVALKVDLTLSKSQIEASSGATATLYSEIKDRYDNVVWNDNSTKLTLEILEKYKHIIKSNSKVQTSSKGKANFTLVGTEIPGTAFFKVSSDPSLSNNFIEIVGQSPFPKSELDSISGMRSDGILTTTGKKFFTDFDLENYRFKYYDKTLLENSDDFKSLNSQVQTLVLNLFDKYNKIILNGVGENAGKIETFYFWNKEKIDGRKYNSIYTTLLGSNYGDITIKDNLANSIIFDRENRALGVTTLLNDTKSYDEVLNINPNGNLSFATSYNQFVQDITTSFDISKDSSLEVTFFNNTFGNLVSKVYYNLPKTGLNLSNCGNVDIKSCFSKNQTTAVLKSINTNYFVENNGNLVLKNKSNNTELLSITSDGKIIKSNDISFKLSQSYKDGLYLDVYFEGKIVGTFAINFVNGKVNIFREIGALDSLVKYQSEGGILVYLEGKDYFFKETYLGSSTKEIKGYTISYNDPFASSDSLNNFSTYFNFGYESFYDNSSLGWEADNKILLSFAAGKTIGEATKDFATFSLINIGDPVASLKKIPLKLSGTEKNRKYDSTIGYLISKDEDNLAYNIFDYNNDKNEDIVVLKRGGYIELLEGTGVFGDFIKRGNIAYIADLKSDTTIETGDFTGDGFADIVLLNKDRKPILLNNKNKDFERINLNLDIKGTISQIVAYDMDLDKKSDLVVLDDSGELNIFYGTGVKGKFLKLNLGTGIGITLNSGVRNDMGAIYYEGLYQLPKEGSQDFVTESEELLKQLESNINKTTDENGFNEGIIDNLIFTQMNYSPWQDRNDDIFLSGMTLPESVLTPEMVSGLQNQEDSINQIASTFSQTGADSTLPTSSLEIAGIENAITDSESLMNSLYENSLGSDLYSVSSENDQISNTVTTFLKSEYANQKGLNVEKKFTDINGNTLKSGDKITLNIKITNTNTQTINNIAYVDSIPNNFEISTNPEFSLKVAGKQINSSDIIISTPTNSDYSFIIDSYLSNGLELPISLKSGESIELSLILDTLPFEYGYIDVGHFDTTSKHGDVIFKTKNENCGKAVDIFKSQSTRTYIKDKKESVCENELPDSVKENAIDEDNNGVPDYIDELLMSSNTGAVVQEYSQESLDDINADDDGDGLPDGEDVSPTYDDSEDDFMNSLDDINEDVDEIMAGIDTILAGLSCGFGGGSCISAPINRAPLAPGQDLSIFGLPVGDGLNIGEGLPVFSALTGKWYGPVCGPSVWPASPLTTVGCGSLGAGGRLGTMNPANFIRIFVTPTLTGAMGMAVCFGGPAIIAGQSNPKGLHPFVPGGNCIVAATPMFGCKDDGSDGEIENMGEGNIINGTPECSSGSDATNIYLGETAGSYINYKETGNKQESLEMDLEEIFSTVAKGPSPKWEIPSGPLLNLGDGSNPDFSVDVDFSAAKKGNFGDVLNISMKRISPFPDFIMDWVTRQIEEIANKLTDFPTLYIILPDMSGVYDDRYGNLLENLQNSYESGEQKAEIEQQKTQEKINNLENQTNNMDCENNQMGCMANDLEIKKLEAQKNITQNKAAGGIKAAYEFMSNLPLISLEPQKVKFNLPWVDKRTIDKAIADFESTKKQRSQELERSKKQWNIDQYNCVSNSQSQECKNVIQTQGLINSIDKNIEILKTYKEIPEKVFQMSKIKEIRMEQILCNLETISKITGGRIGENGKRFKAWVELYVLIKAILKSWQLLIDVFVDYDAACHECKNERYDLMYFVWKLISMVIPKIPVIQFPKWPDIYLDLHNIRIQLNIQLPEFEFNFRPILIPTLPNLYLPDSPNVNLSLPRLPLLPEFELPTLPDLPSLPSIELPDLPPPPKLPKLLSAISAYLDILKIITKVMCILKTSPFVPEWRAGDQIAFITERSGYLALDFLDISMPQFSFPFVDAIKVTSFVNLEFDVEFLVEMARQTALPINVFTNDIANMLNIGIGDLDYRGVTPEKIDLSSGEVETSYNIGEDKKVSIFDFSVLLSLNLLKLQNNINKDSKIDYTNEEFKKAIARELPKIQNQKIVGVWQNALNYSFTSEDKLIDELLKNNSEKFNELKTIINEEKTKNNEQINQIKQKLEQKPEINTLVSSQIETSNISEYNTRLEKYNQKVIKSVPNLYKEDLEVKEIRQKSKEVVDSVKSGMEKFQTKLNESKTAFENVKINNYDKLLATNTTTTTTAPQNEKTVDTNSTQTSTASSNTSCSTSSNGYSYVYKGIYIVEKFLNKKISYLLFAYLDELTGKEVAREADFDNDGDQDIIYMVGNEIYLKQNLNQEKQVKDLYTGSPIILNTNNNPYFSGEFFEAINGFDETISDNNYVNIGFDNSTNENISNYRIEFYSIFDKFDDVVNNFSSDYIPKNIKSYVIDAFRDIDDITLNMEKVSSFYTIRKNLAYIDNIGNLAGIKLTTNEIIDLGNDINQNKEITINAETKIYSGNGSSKLVYYYYKDRNNELKLKDITIPAYANISFSEDIILVGINGNAYVEGNNKVELSGNQIINYVKKPLFVGSKIEYEENEVSTLNPYISINYYDGTEFDIDFGKTKYYELYDLGFTSDSYLVRTQMENNFYYAKIRSFKENLFSTYGNQIVLSPQKESDSKAPELSGISSIEVPVYQKKIIDLTDYIYENSGIKNITDIYIDFDLEKDSDLDGDTYNDRDFAIGKTGSGFDITKEGSKILLNVGPFDKLIYKEIMIYLVDSNNNIGDKNLNFVVYSPETNISGINENLTISGSIDEELKNEPISMYRIRGGGLTRLKDVNSNFTTNTFNTGSFVFEPLINTQTGLELYYSGETLLKIDENTGKITISDFIKLRDNIELKVYSSNNENNELAYPKIVVTKDNLPIYYEYLVSPNSLQVQQVQDFTEVTDGNYKDKIGVYYKHNLENYTFIQMPLGIANNAGDLFVYDKNDTKQTPIFTIFKDGRINTINEMYYLEYSTFDDYVVYNLRKVGTEEIIGNVMIIPEKNFIMK